MSGKLYLLSSMAGLLSCSSLGAIELESKNITTIYTSTELESVDISYPGKASSFFTQGGNFNLEVNVLNERRIASHWDSRFEFNIRGTDNPQVDPEHWSVEKFRWKLNDQNNEIVLGDYFANFSQYTLNKSIKGIGYQHDLGDKQNYFRVAYGSFDGQWEYVYDNPLNEPMNRTGGGMRYQRAGDKHRWGLNLVHVSDEKGDSNRGATIDAYEQVIASSDWEYRTRKFRFNGEHALSKTKIDKNSAANVKETGAAHNLRMKGKFAGVFLTGKFENVSPKFKSLAGGATPDRRRYSLRGNYRINKLWRLKASYNRYHDKLSGSTATSRTTNSTVSMGLTRARLFDRKRLKLTVGLRHKEKEKNDKTRDTDSRRLTLAVSDRIFKNINYRLNYQRVFDEDNVASTNSTDHLYSFNISSRHRLKNGWRLQPRLHLAYQDSDNITTMGDDIVKTFRAALQATSKSGDEVGVEYQYVANNVFSGTDSVNRRFHSFWEMPVKSLKNGTLRFSWENNDYQFTHDTPEADYKENVIRALLQFDIL